VFTTPARVTLWGARPMASLLCRFTASAFLSRTCSARSRTSTPREFRAHFKSSANASAGSANDSSIAPDETETMSNDFGTFNKTAASTAAERNKVPIAEAFVSFLVKNDVRPGVVLELACGSGQHAAHLADELPEFTFQPTDLDDSSFETVKHFNADKPNVKPPMLLDACDSSWGSRVRRSVTPEEEFAAVLIINMTHISPWSATLGALAGAAEVLRPGGALFIYGPFKRGGAHTSEGNATFDETLRGRNTEWGYRDIDKVVDEAEKVGFGDAEIVEMPANNFALTCRKKQHPSS